MTALGEAGRGADPLIRRAQDPKFGDYQSNAAMGLAKATRQKPRDVAQRIVEALGTQAEFTAACEAPEIAGPGFINLRLKPAYLAASLSAIPSAPVEGEAACHCRVGSVLPTEGSPSDRTADTAVAHERTIDRLGIEPAPEPQIVIVDYSGPNVAKQMHVGHLRSTIIGDVIVRVLEFEGHKPIRRNHVGDWGLQMGQMLRRMTTSMPSLVGGGDESAVVANIAEHLEEIERQYKAAQAEEKGNPALAEESRQWVVRLQGGDEDALRIWRCIRRGTLLACQRIYDRLGVLLGEADVQGESFYNDKLVETVDELRRALSGETGPGTVREDQGALCVFHRNEKGEPAFKNPEGEPLPLIIQKTDGAFLYATTDLAAVRFRVRELHADRVIYVTGAPQALHFQMVFATARAAGWTRRPGGREVRLEHVAFGSVLGEDRKILRTRSGENVKLKDLLDEAVARAEQLVRQSEADPAKRRGFSEEQIKAIAEAVGIGAVKYADLAQNRTTDYVFSWDKMLAMDGNTAPYMMYAYARIRSIYAKAAAGSDEGRSTEAAPAVGAAPSSVLNPQSSIALVEPAEIDLARRILQFAETIEAVAEELKPNILTSYLYDLAGAFMRFYESCPVLKAPTPAIRESRLRLCDLTARTLRAGLNLLGIRVVERM